MEWDHVFADRVTQLPESDMGLILKVAGMKDVITFAGGLPPANAFPVEDIKRAANDVLTKNGSGALQYGAAPGYQPLREIIAGRMRARGVKAEADNVLITCGSQQGLAFLAHMFINPGDIVLIEEPGYIGGIQAFVSYGAQFVGIPMDDQGMRMDILEAKLKELHQQGKYPKFIYTVPTFQNPTSVTMSLKRREALINISKKYDILIVEDNAYGELRYDGEEIPLLKALDDEEKVIHLGSFSKILSPGMRTAWTVAHKDLIARMVDIRQNLDLGPNIFAQTIIAQYCEMGLLESHVQESKNIYKPKRDAMMQAIKKYFPAEVKVNYPQGGFFTWAELPEGMDTQAMFDEVLKEKVAYLSGADFYTSSNVKNTMRLCYSNSTLEQIEEGIKRLGTAIKKQMDK